MLDHGLFKDQPPPSVDVLLAWLKEQGVEVSDGVQIAPMADGSGWRVVATRDLEPVESIVKIPKTALLSTRNSDLPPLPTTIDDVVTASQTVFDLALALLHEIRLGAESKFWGYIQSLPRSTIPIPPLWPLVPTSGDDAPLASDWLTGTEASRAMRRRQLAGLGLDSMRQFYAAAVTHLPPTRSHPVPSPFEAFAHAYSLVSTRAFLIDLYHLVALCPFADILNHSGAGHHTSLASDDFVCHRCGSLRACAHDGPVSDRLSHLAERERARLSQPDTVDMYVEHPVLAGREVMNTYGEGLGESRLLIEWGFVPSNDDDAEEGRDEPLTGEACTWEPEEILTPTTKEIEVVEAANSAASRLFDEDNDDSLLCRPSRGAYHLNYAGQLSLRLFAVMYARHAPLKYLVGDVRTLDDAWAEIQDGAEVYPLPAHLRAVAHDLRTLFQKRMDAMHRPELGIGELYDLRDALPEDARLQVMAMTVAINERALLRSAIGRWDELLGAVE